MGNTIDKEEAFRKDFEEKDEVIVDVRINDDLYTYLGEVFAMCNCITTDGFSGAELSKKQHFKAVKYLGKQFRSHHNHMIAYKSFHVEGLTKGCLYYDHQNSHVILT